MIKKFEEFVNEYHNGGVSAKTQVDDYFFPPFLWSDVKLGTTEIDRAGYFVVFDGVEDTKVMPDGKLMVRATPDAIMEIILDFFDVMNDEHLLGEFEECMGKKPETEEEIIEYLRTDK